MSISLVKGAGISLTKEAPHVTKFYFGLGWDEQANVDPDVSAFLCKTNAAGDPMLFPNDGASDPSEHDYGNAVFFNNKVSADGAVKHGGDNRSGKNNPAFAGTAAAEDDESIYVDIAALNPNIDEISVVVTIDEAASRRQTFTNVRNSFIRICENDGLGREIARYKLSEDFAAFTAVQFGSLVKTGSDWNFEAVGQGYVADFPTVVNQFCSAS